MKKASELPEVLEVKDLQAFLGIGRGQAYSLVKSNSFHAVTVGKRILIPRKSFLTWFEGSTEDPLATHPVKEEKVEF
ncbi:helix-turn-helix domain-containing protein [Neobacillus sp. PS2-9]|uniref:helix-turn-helix domain-containing protein n=1 Tax=Neobacillus sp. PS2-9 TaxID=3070676 RepID=UPI0027E12264|nr:helix-turn-helix domain-containing protein [Neobacillus sp. PS2-9]WML56674.1 helix-turn-helix domain-containing protein [Neobacillus sp. PS2-9]